MSDICPSNSLITPERIDGVTFRSLRTAETEQCLDLWLSVWPGDNNPAYFKRYFYGDVEWLPYYTQVAECDGRIVSSVQICKRIVACGEFNLTMGGIANVATMQEYRKRGLNSQLMRRAIAVMEADAMDFSLLFTGINRYYQGFGYSNLTRRTTSVRIREDYALPKHNFDIRVACAEDIVPIRRIHEAYNASRPIAVRRSEAYWRDWLRVDPAAMPAGLRVACDSAGKVCGYLSFGRFNSAIPYSAADEAVRVIEVGMAAGTCGTETDIAVELLGSIIEEMSNLGRAAVDQTLLLETPKSPSLIAALRTMSAADGISSTISTSAMVRLLHSDALLRSLTMVWNERWLEADRPRGQVSFATPYGIVSVDATGDLLKIISGMDKSETGTISHSNLFDLMFGAISPADATGDNKLHPLLAALFPPQEMIFWAADGF